MALLLLRGLFGRLLLGGRAGKQTGQAGQGNLAPALALVRMETMRGGELVDRLLLFQQFAHHLRFEGWAVRLFHGFSLP